VYDQALEANYKRFEVKDNRFNLITGGPGTGKTFLLVCFAKELVQKHKKVLFLTYNRALTNDIDLIITNLSVRGDVVVRTIDSLMSEIMKSLDCDNKENTLRGIRSLVEGESSKNILKKTLELIFDHVLIDEAQDVDPIEVKILHEIFGSERMTVSVGDRQFVNDYPFDWKMYLDGNNINFDETNLDVNKRNRPVIVDFLNKFSSSYKMTTNWKIKKDGNQSGGHVDVIQGPFKREKILSVLNENLENCLKEGTQSRDMLVIIPSTNNDERFSEYQELLHSWDKPILDLSKIEDRRERRFPDQVRVINYHSCRGLEGWAVVILGFDRILEQLNRHGGGRGETSSYVNDWLYMILTRAIDRLVIIYDQPDSITFDICYSAKN
jgi:superfamily I DNA/RNA helicase